MDGHLYLLDHEDQNKLEEYQRITTVYGPIVSMSHEEAAHILAWMVNKESRKTVKSFINLHGDVQVLTAPD
jgi:hypothetical protein